MTENEKVQPCDKIIVPVFHTFAGTKGLRVDKEMFDESFVICLRWQDNHRRTQQHRRESRQVVRQAQLLRPGAEGVEV